MKIENIEDLLKFIDNNFDRISHINYIDLLRETLSVWVHSKPSDKATALKEIAEHHQYLMTFDDNQELPLLMRY